MDPVQQKEARKARRQQSNAHLQAQQMEELLDDDAGGDEYE